MAQKKVLKKYRFTVVATDVVLFMVRDGKLNVLLIQMKRKPYEGKWAAPGGLVSSEESVDDAARRVLEEKTGVRKALLEQLATFGDPGRDPFGRVVSVAYMALLPSEEIDIHTTTEYAHVRWFPVAKLPRLAYDHKAIVGCAVERLRSKLAYSDIAAGLVPETFPLSRLQEVYEIILGKALDKRNFRKKLLSTGLVERTGKTRREGASRPAELFRFSRKVSKIALTP